MAKVQYNYLQRKDAYSTAATGTVTYDLPTRGVIPELILRVYSTPAAATNPALPLNDAITKIEIVDGGTVIKSYTGNQCHALEMFHLKQERASTEKNDNQAEGYDDFLIVLGKKVNGVDYAPDFSRFTNPQIKITWDYSLTVTQFGMPTDAEATPVMKFTLIAKIVREGGKYTHGYIKSSQITTWNSVDSTTTQTEIPLGEKLLGFMIEAGYTETDWTEDIEQIKLDFDNGAWIPLDLYEEDISDIQGQWFKTPFEISWRADVKDSNVVDCHMGYLTYINAVPAEYTSGQTCPFWAYPSDTMCVGTLRILSGTEVASVYEQFKIIVNGYMPYQCWYCPSSILLDGEGDLIDTATYSRIVLQTVSGSSVNTSSSPAVVCEYFVT